MHGSFSRVVAGSNRTQATQFQAWQGYEEWQRVCVTAALCTASHTSQPTACVGWVLHMRLCGCTLLAAHNGGGLGLGLIRDAPAAVLQSVDVNLWQHVVWLCVGRMVGVQGVRCACVHMCTWRLSRVLRAGVCCSGANGRGSLPGSSRSVSVSCKWRPADSGVMRVFRPLLLAIEATAMKGCRHFLPKGERKSLCAQQTVNTTAALVDSM